MRDPHTQLDLEVAAAVDLFRRGEPAAAEVRCRAVLARAPQHRDARVLLALVLHFAKRYGEAETIFTELTRDEPHEPAHWANLGAARRGASRKP
jgi:predicted Zn-dependent protease